MSLEFPYLTNIDFVYNKCMYNYVYIYAYGSTSLYGIAHNSTHLFQLS